MSRERKAFKIINQKQVDIHNLLISDTAEEYNSYTHWLGHEGNLTEKEFKLLKKEFSK